MFIPWLLIIIGGLFLLENLDLLPWFNWSIAWPIILILAGLFMMKKKSGYGCYGWHEDKKEEESK